LGIFFELQNPGVVLPGVIGGISLILAFFAFQSLPINWAGVLLILFGVALLIAEIKIASHGVLTIGGVISMVLGSFMLYDAPEVGFRVSWPVILPTGGSRAGLFAWGVSAGVRAMRRPAVTGAAGMVGRLAVTRGDLGPEGHVNVDGEIWRAVAEGGAIPAGEKVRVTAVDGLTLRVSRAGDSAQAPQEASTMLGGLDWTLGLIPVVIIAFFVLLNAVRILREYERAVIFRFGRQSPAIINPGGDGSGPGLLLLIPFVDKMVK